MAERLRVLDGVCPSCKAIVMRVSSPAESDENNLEDGAMKDQIRAAGLVPIHYQTHAPLRETANHKPNCKLHG